MRIRRAWLLAAVVALGCALDPPAPPPAPAHGKVPAAGAATATAPAAAPISVARVQALSRTLEKIRGRKFKREVAVTFVTLAKLRPRLIALFDAEMPPDRLAREALLLRALRLLPAGADLRQLYLTLLGAQVVGLYDPASQALFVVTDYKTPGGEGGLPGLSGLSLTDIAIVHELDHALSDQYFSLDAQFRKVRGQRDAEAALQALVEGEATLAMVQYALRETLGNAAGPDGANPDGEGELLETVGAQLAPASLMGLTANDPTLKGIPPFLVQHLAASYADGFQYTLRAWQKGGWAAVDALYQNPPGSTREVLGGPLASVTKLREPDCAPGVASLREAPGAQDIRLWSYIQSGDPPAAGPPRADDSRLAICGNAAGTSELRWIVSWNSGEPPDSLRRAARKTWPAARVEWKPGGRVEITAPL